MLLHKSVVGEVQPLQHALSDQFDYLFGNKPYTTKWDWALALQKLFNRLVEDRIDLNRLRQAGGPWAALREAYGVYEGALAHDHACDFSILLRYFRDFLDTAQGNLFLNGDSAGVRLPTTHVLVDEYQDTNPIQESIYLRLCDAQPHNLTVVGDDGQALYRFRGGTVECMVGFPSACRARWGVTPEVIYLSSNYRSDQDIVNWCNDYITSFPQMVAPNVRIAGKPALQSPVGRTGAHPAVGLIRAGTINGCAAALASLVSALRENSIIEDYSQCVLLLRSTRNSPRFAGPYTAALQAQGISVYNPRSRDYLEQDEVSQCLGAFVRIVDPQLVHTAGVMSPKVQRLVQRWVSEYDSISTLNPSLASYVEQSGYAIASRGVRERITTATPTIIYRILSHQPFTGYQASPERDLRISKLTRIFESFCAQYGRQLWTDDSRPGQLPGWWYGSFLYGLCGYLVQKGLDDDEEEEVVSPVGYFPIMTVHQAKGLEFDFVFVGNLGGSVSASDAHSLERDLRQFRHSPPAVVHAISEAQWHDDIRQHFVAYSRARFALVLVATNGQLRSTGVETASFGSSGGEWVRHNIPRL